MAPIQLPALYPLPHLESLIRSERYSRVADFYKGRYYHWTMPPPTEHWTYANTLSALSALFSLLALTIAYRAYRKFLVRKAQERQLEVVLQLLESVHASKNFIEIMNVQIAKPTLGGTIAITHPLRLNHNYSIFEMIVLPEFSQELPLYFHPSMEDGGEGIAWDFYTKFQANPLLPRSIASRLKVFEHVKGALHKQSMGESAVILFADKGNTFYVEKSFPMLKTTTSFKSAVIELRRSMIDWMKSYGIKDVNLD